MKKKKKKSELCYGELFPLHRGSASFNRQPSVSSPWLRPEVRAPLFSIADKSHALFHDVPQ